MRKAGKNRTHTIIARQVTPQMMRVASMLVAVREKNQELFYQMRRGMSNDFRLFSPASSRKVRKRPRGREEKKSCKLEKGVCFSLRGMV